MTKFPLIAALAVATVAVAAPAAAKDKQSFTHDGVTYVYTETKVGESLVIKGYAVNGQDFYYVVRNGRVVGKAGDAPVDFSVADAITADASSQVASAN
ncbi:MAG TPA: hypothetical protein VGE65_00845 [Sphingobium sp.]